ncbi:DUF1569 domain-containing protein [Singulisphaera rosea]
MGERRDLSFESLDEVMPEVERLLAGHSMVGTWTLGQVLHHLSEGIRLSVEGPAGPAEPTREQDVFRRRLLRSGRFPEKAEIPVPSMVPPEGLDAHAEAEALRTAIARLVSSEGPFPPHPKLGPLQKEEWLRFHSIHCAHHLRFAVPAAAQSPRASSDP